MTTNKHNGGGVSSKSLGLFRTLALSIAVVALCGCYVLFGGIFMKADAANTWYDAVDGDIYTIYLAGDDIAVHARFDAAVANFEDDKTYKFVMQNDLETASQFMFSSTDANNNYLKSNLNLIFDLNGYTLAWVGGCLYNDEDVNSLFFANCNSFELTDSSSAQSGKIKGFASPIGLVNIVVDSYFTFSGGEIANNYGLQLFYVVGMGENSEFNLSGGKITNNNYCTDFSIANFGTINISGGEISENYFDPYEFEDVGFPPEIIETFSSDQYGLMAGVMVYSERSGTVNMSGGKIVGTGTEVMGTVWVVEGQITFNITGGEISNTNDKASIMGAENSVLNISGGKVGRVVGFAAENITIDEEKIEILYDEDDNVIGYTDKIPDAPETPDEPNTDDDDNDNTDDDDNTPSTPSTDSNKTPSIDEPTENKMFIMLLIGGGAALALVLVGIVIALLFKRRKK